MQHNLAPQELPDLAIDTLGKAAFDSPLKNSGRQFVDDSESVHVYSHNKLVQKCIETLGNVPGFELSGPREKFFFVPAKLNCGIGYRFRPHNTSMRRATKKSAQQAKAEPAKTQ